MNYEKGRIGPAPLERQPEHFRDRVTVDERRCPGCKETKPWYRFGLTTSTSTGLANKCLVCEREYQREWRERRKRLADNWPVAESEAATADKRRSSLEKARAVRSENAARKREEKMAMVEQARQTGREIAVRPEPPAPVPVNELASMLFSMTVSEEEPKEDVLVTRLRYELAARILDGQGEILKMLLQR